MPEESSFTDLIGRVRLGDALAAEELVRRYEPAIRVAVRVRLTDPNLRRLLDSMDICQSVLANFFVRAAAGQFALDKPEQLLGLLATMARNKLTNHALAQQAERRDARRVASVDQPELLLADPGATPSRIVEQRELLAEARRRFTPDELAVVDARADGQAWAEIAARRGETADALRVRFHRAVDRVARELELES